MLEKELEHIDGLSTSNTDKYGQSRRYYKVLSAG